MPDVKKSPNLITGHWAQFTAIRCVYHAHEARYKIKSYDKERLVVIECLECKPPQEICRFAVDPSRDPNKG